MRIGAVQDELPNRIRVLRKQRGFSQFELAERLDATTQQVSHLERGKRRLTLQWMQRVAAALECDPADLLPSRDRPTVGNPREEALLNLFRALPSAEQDAFLKIGDAMAQPEAVVKTIMKRRGASDQ